MINIYIYIYDSKLLKPHYLSVGQIETSHKVGYTSYKMKL